MSKGKVLLCMSGGIDSSVAAMLLEEQGYELHGIDLSPLRCDIAFVHGETNRMLQRRCNFRGKSIGQRFKIRPLDIRHPKGI